MWDSNPVKVCETIKRLMFDVYGTCRFQINYFASHLYDSVGDEKNLIFLVNQFENRSTFAFYLSLTMLWKAIYRCIGEEKTMFRLYQVRAEASKHFETFWNSPFVIFFNFQPSNIVELTKEISKKKLDTDYASVLNFLLLHSKIASLIFHSKRRTPHYKCYEEFFTFDLSLVKTIKEFLESTMAKVESMWRKDNENLDYLMVCVAHFIVGLVIGRCSFLFPSRWSNWYSLISRNLTRSLRIFSDIPINKC